MYYIYGIYWVYDVQLEFTGSQFLVLSGRTQGPHVDVRGLEEPLEPKNHRSNHSLVDQNHKTAMFMVNPW